MTAARLRARLAGQAERERDAVSRALEDNVETGFQIAAAHGPLCAEPMEGLAFFVERVEIDRSAVDKEIGACAAMAGTGRGGG
jgi:ribosome assembly protein 1